MGTGRALRSAPEAGLCGAVRCGATLDRFSTQGPCGSCWTFSTTGCLESAIAIATGKLLSLVGDNGPFLGTSGGAAGRECSVPGMFPSPPPGCARRCPHCSPSAPLHPGLDAVVFGRDGAKSGG